MNGLVELLASDLAVLGLLRLRCYRWDDSLLICVGAGDHSGALVNRCGNLLDLPE
jgi:hypothetical protein